MRRAALVFSAAFCLFAACHGAAPVPPIGGAAPVGSLERLDPAFDALVPPGATIDVLAEGFDWSEGPVWRKSGGYLLFSDIPKNTINKWRQGSGISVFLRPAGYAGSTPFGRELGSNGLTFDASDRSEERRVGKEGRSQGVPEH